MESSESLEGCIGIIFLKNYITYFKNYQQKLKICENERSLFVLPPTIVESLFERSRIRT